MKFLLLTALMLSIGSLQASVTPTELVIKLKEGRTLPDFGADTKVQNLFGRIYVLRNKDVSNLEKQLSINPNIEYTERNYKAEKSVLPKPFAAPESEDKALPTSGQFNDPKVSKIWSFDDASRNGVSVEAAYRLHATEATETIIVAVVDTGVDYNHEDLKDVMWTNTKEIPENGIDDDGNGYIDDIHGINVLVRDANGKATMNIMDTHSHGTHVSGTIGAKQNNGIGIAGIASNVRIMGIRTVPNSADETDVDVAEAFVYAAKNGAKIINCSFGKRTNEGKNLIPETLKYIQDNYGVLVIAAAGNDSDDIDKNPTYPASHKSDNLLIVASTTNTGGMSGFSNYGKINVDVAAPGSNIYSSVPGNKYEMMSGTSMASPTTVGVAAEVLSHYPNLSPLQLKQVLIDSVTKIDRFKDKMVAGGRIDLLKALGLARTIH
ncbi:MAG: S8 family serine peptidase [Bacteriovorax sp.]|nr:S8 family serine peptidase [Bacteriovorax sp.]